MSNFFEELWRAQMESFRITGGFIREHPVGYSVLILTAMAIPFIPYACYRIKEEMRYRKFQKELQK